MKITTLDLKTTGPRYAQISGIMAEEIRRAYRPGDKLPPEQALANRFAVNRHTLRRAVDELVRVGMVERRWGVGVFVLAPFVSDAQSVSVRVTEDLQRLGDGATHTLMALQEIPASLEIAGWLGIPEGAPAIWIETTGHVAAQAVFVRSQYLEAAKFGACLESYDGDDLNRFLQRQAGVQLLLASSLITAEIPAIEDARHLGIPKQQPVLYVKCLYHEPIDHHPTAVTLTRCRADRLQIGISF